MAIITISRGSFSGAKELAETVASKLGYKCISREDIIKDAAEYGITGKILTSILLKDPVYWSRFDEIKRQYLTLVRHAILKEAAGHNIVYHGHAGHFLLKKEHCWTLKLNVGGLKWKI